MLTPSSGTLADYNAAILNGNATHVRIVFPVQNKTFTDADITADSGITVNSILNGDTDLFMGKAVSREIIIHFLNNGQFTGFDWTEEFHVDFGVEISGSTNWVTFGYFTGVKPERVTRTEVIEFTAKDCMGSRFDILADDFIASLTFPKTLGSIYSALCTYVGITSATGNEDSTVMNITYSANPFTNGVSCRQILAWIAEANCCYAKIDSANKVKLVWFTDQTSNYGITGDDYFEINVDETATPDIDVIRVNSAEDENARYMYPVGANGVEYQIVDNPLLLNMLATNRTTALTKMLARLNAVCGYIPMSVNAVGNWMVEDGDIIEVTYDTSTTENMPVFARSLQWNGGCNDVYECTGNAERTEMSASYRESYITGGKLSNKYTIQSGIDITDAGIQVSGGKFVKILSGGVFDVDSTNFKISSTNKSVTAGNWAFNDYGVTYEYDNTSEVLSFKMCKATDIANAFQILTRFSDMGNSDVGITILHSSYGADESCVIRPANTSVLNFIGGGADQFDRVYSKRYYGDGIANNLTTNTDGYALDARQGKALANAILGTTYELEIVNAHVISLDDNNCVRVGNMVIGSARFETDATINAGNAIIKGMPHGKTTLANGSSFAACASYNPSEAFSLCNLSTGLNVVTAVQIPAGTHVISFSYVTDAS